MEGLFYIKNGDQRYVYEKHYNPCLHLSKSSKLGFCHKVRIKLCAVVLFTYTLNKQLFVLRECHITLLVW